MYICMYYVYIYNVYTYIIYVYIYIVISNFYILLYLFWWWLYPYMLHVWFIYGPGWCLGWLMWNIPAAESGNRWRPRPYIVTRNSFGLLDLLKMIEAWQTANKMEACVIRMTETCCKSSNFYVPVLVGLNMFELLASPRAWLLTAPGSFLLYPLWIIGDPDPISFKQRIRHHKHSLIQTMVYTKKNHIWLVVQ